MLRLFLILLVLPMNGLADIVPSINMLDDYNVRWTSPSTNASESMPLGGGDIGCNVWVEQGDLLLYFQRSGSLSEIGEYLKMGRLRIQLSPNPLAVPAKFRQELLLRDGCIEIEATGKDDAGFSVKLRLWVEIERPVIHVDVESERPIEVAASYENWRIEDKELKSKPSNERFGCFTLEGWPGKVIKRKDDVSFEGEGVIFRHRNPAQSLLPSVLIRQQELENHADEIPDMTDNNTFGGFFRGAGFRPDGTQEGVYQGTPYRAWRLKSKEAARNHRLQVATHIAIAPDETIWRKNLMELVKEVSQKESGRLETTVRWWHSFWARSWIHVWPDHKDTGSKPWQAGRNYNLFRYQLGCNIYGAYPTKFNGGNFTFDPVLIDRKKGRDPDWRAWGGDVFTAQNQRLVYWPMLKSGDFEALKSEFNIYLTGLPGARLKARTSFGHGGAVFSEYASTSGLDLGAGWGWKGSSVRSRGPEVPFGDPSVNGLGGYGAPVEHGIMANGSISYHWEGQVERAYMMLENYRYSRENLRPYLPFIHDSLVFFDEHYQARQKLRTGKPLDEQGKLVFFPSTCCESYRGAKNPLDLLSGIHACLESLLKLEDGILTTEQRSYYQGYLKRLPGWIYYDEINGDRIVKPAESWLRYQNVECPQFYPLFPFNRFNLSSPEIPVFQNTWKHGTFAKNMVQSWHQDGIFFARMGMTKEAAEFNVRKLQNAPRRYPTFWGPGHDWTPDHNWGGSGMIGLQEMLLQTVGNELRVFPAWPREWDVDFKLHAPDRTTVECSLRAGKIQRIEVNPVERRKDIIVPEWK